MKQDVLLQMTDICKEFPGVKALDHVSLTVKAGTVHALMGENGAGKSTLMKFLFFISNPPSIKLSLEAQMLTFNNSQHALPTVLPLVHQALTHTPNTTYLDPL